MTQASRSAQAALGPGILRPGGRDFPGLRGPEGQEGAARPVLSGVSWGTEAGRHSIGRGWEPSPCR